MLVTQLTNLLQTLSSLTGLCINLNLISIENYLRLGEGSKSVFIGGSDFQVDHE